MQAYVLAAGELYKVFLWDGDGADKWVTSTHSFADAQKAVYWMNEAFKYAKTYRPIPE